MYSTHYYDTRFNFLHRVICPYTPSSITSVNVSNNSNFRTIKLKNKKVELIGTDINLTLFWMLFPSDNGMV